MKTENLPESFRKELSDAGKLGRSHLTREQKVAQGRAAWQARLAKHLRMQQAQGGLMHGHALPE